MITKGDRYREISAVLARHGIGLVEDEFIKHEAGDQARAEHLRRDPAQVDAPQHVGASDVNSFEWRNQYETR